MSETKMKRAFAKNINATLVILLLLVGLKGLHAVGWPDGAARAMSTELLSTLSKRGLNKEAREALTAGYYEGLLNEGSRVSAMNRFVLDNRKPGREENRRPDRQETNNFLSYELIPNDSRRDYEDDRFRYMLKTNSVGMSDKEYTLAKPERTRRIALMGDSITRGQGAPFGESYEPLLEDKLNQSHTTAQTDHIEILNFAVGGYHITQQYEAAITKATAYNPDVYVVALSDLTVYRRWHGHIATLVYSGVDLRYDFLRNLVREARLTPSDPIGVFDARLARFRIPTIRWVLTELRAHAASHNAQLFAILVPSADDPDVLAEAFLGIPEVLKELDIPFVDLLGTFANVEDPGVFSVATDDRHPNAAGHRLLFENLYAKLLADPALMQIFTICPRFAGGVPGPPPVDAIHIRPVQNSHSFVYRKRARSTASRASSLNVDEERQ